MDFVDMQVPRVGPLAVNTAGSIVGFISLFLFYRAVLAGKLVGFVS